MKNNRVFALSLALLLAASGLWAAPQAVLQSLKGKVEVKVPGSASWAAATDGQTLDPATVLSTGFDSSVVVAIGKTTIQVKPLTRLTIDKLIEEGGAVKTSTFLRVGNISASVKSADGVKQDFKVQSPFSTASVRGTEFEFDGIKLSVREGLVAFILGRLERESQPVEGGEAPAVDHSGDFVGSPDVAGDPDKGIPVPAGNDVTLVIDYKGGGTSTSGSGDLDNLKKDSGQGQNGPATTNTPPPTRGGVKLSIQWGS